MVLDTSEGQKIAKTLGSKKTVILQNHGILTVGQSVERRLGAIWRWKTPARPNCWPRPPVPPSRMPPEVAGHTAGQVGGEAGGFWAFSPTGR